MAYYMTEGMCKDGSSVFSGVDKVDVPQNRASLLHHQWDKECLLPSDAECCKGVKPRLV